MHPDDDNMQAYEPYHGPERRTTTRATSEAQNEIKATLEGITDGFVALKTDVGWIKRGLAYGLTVLGGVLVLAIGLIVTYTVSTHNDIARLQEQLARFDTLAKSHHNANGCHFLATPGGLP